MILQNTVHFLLLLTIISGLVGLFLFEDNLRKIAGLAAAYSGIIILMIFLFKDDQKSKELFALITTTLIIFSVTLAAGIEIVSEITKMEINSGNKIINSNSDLNSDSD